MLNKIVSGSGRAGDYAGGAIWPHKDDIYLRWAGPPKWGWEDVGAEMEGGDSNEMGRGGRNWGRKGAELEGIPGGTKVWYGREEEGENPYKKILD